MIGYSLGATVMMQLGSFQFSINTAAYKELRRRTDYRWAAQDRFGQLAALQYTGPGSDSIALSGVVYGDYRGGTGQIEAMRSVAGQGFPQLLIDGYGNLLGRWVIDGIEESQTVFAAAGRPRKQEFTLQLRKRD
jgi:phage protein U